MKILLVRPHSTVPSAAPPLGLLYLSSYLRAHSPRHQVSICDARFKEYDFNTIEGVIRDERPDLLGITSFSMESKEAHEIAKRAKSHFPGMPIILGGPYASSDYEQALADKNFDIAVIGEAERSFHQLVEGLDHGHQGNGSSWTGVRELAYRKNGSIVKTDMREYVEDLDELPYPAWDLVNLEEYFSRRGTRKRTSMNPHQMKHRLLGLQTTRGCPYKCTYCHNLFGKKIRKRSVENVIGELRLMKDTYKVEEVEILDDIFNLDLDRAKQIFRRIIEEKLDMKFSFPNALRSDRFDEEFLDLMKTGGAYRLVFAIESGTPRIQKLIKKNLNLDEAKKNIALAAQRGFSLGGYFMIGFFDETEEEVWNTINFALESKLHTAAFFVVTPFPNTEMWNQAIELGYNVSGDFQHYQKVSANVSSISTKRLEKLRTIAFRKFYLNPRRLYSFLRTTPWRDRIFEKIWLLIAASFFKYEK